MASRFQLSGVHVAYGERVALAGIDLEIRAGEAVALVGPSGAGKTSLLRLLNGTLRPTSGEVRVCGRLLHSMSRREARALRASVGFMPQHLGLVGSLRVARNVLSGRLGEQSFAGSLRAMLAPSRASLIEVHRLLERVGIEERMYERTDRLSGGEQQRVALARALYQMPGALLADEPVSSLDPARARDSVELMTRTSAERGITLCVSLHSLELARACFDRLIGLRDGRVVFDRSTAALGDADFEALYSLGELEVEAGASRDG